MKWGVSSTEIKNWMIIILIVLIIAGMLIDFISWKTALNLLKKELPIEYQPPATEFIKGLGYIPLIWRGNFSYIRVWTYKTPTEKYVDNIFLRFGEYNLISVDLKKISDNLWLGQYTMTEAGKEYIKNKREGWEKMAQPFGEYAEIFVRINGDKVLIFVLGEDRTFVREFKCSSSEGGCGGGYRVYHWGVY